MTHELYKYFLFAPMYSYVTRSMINIYCLIRFSNNNNTDSDVQRAFTNIPTDSFDKTIIAIVLLISPN